MLKVLLVDDEMLVRLGIKSCINFEKLGLKLIGEASNGHEALEIVEKQLPDIVLLDIRMPVMDGLQFMNIINQRKISTSIVILSCYNDFEYVKEALKLGAKDYILKLSFKPEDLNELLFKITQNIYKSGIDSKDNNEINHQEIKDYVKNLIFAPGFNEPPPQIIEKHYMNLQYVIAKFGYRSDYVESTDRALINIIKEITKEYGYPIIMRERNELLLLLGFEPKYDTKDILEMAERIFNTIRGCLNKEVKISISSIFTDIKESRNSYIKACNSFEHLFYFKNNKIIVHDNSHNALSNAFRINKETEQGIYDSLEMCNTEKLLNIINTVFDEIIATKNLGQQIIINTSLAIISILSRFQSDNNIQIDNMHVNSYDYIMTADNVFELKDWFNILLKKYINTVLEKQIVLKRRELKAAEEYIKANYNRRISLSEISKHVNMSENYFSYLFKKEYNDTFTNYQNRIKIAKAKELMSTRDYKINELSEELGYTDPSYFCKVFKKITGISPEQFKTSTLKHH